MKRFYRRRRLAFAFILVVICYIGYLFISGYMEVRAVRQEIAALQLEIVETQEKKEALEEKIAELNSLEYIEYLAREKLGLVREGETLIRPVYPEGD